MKTQVNPVVKDSTSREAFRNDGLPRSIQTGVLKGALALVDLMQSASDINVPDNIQNSDHQAAVQNVLATQRKAIMLKGVKTLKCLAYASTRVNSLHRRLQ